MIEQRIPLDYLIGPSFLSEFKDLKDRCVSDDALRPFAFRKLRELERRYPSESEGCYLWHWLQGGTLELNRMRMFDFEKHELEHFIRNELVQKSREIDSQK